MKIDSVGHGIGPELLLLELGGGNSGHEKGDYMKDPAVLAGSFVASVWIWGRLLQYGMG
jgi:hypothetical protein